MNDNQRLLSESSQAGQTTDLPSDAPGDLSDELERLKQHVHAAISEIQRLRQENRKLSEHLNRLENDPAAFSDDTLLAFDEDPDQLREHIQQFIDTIDRHLETPHHQRSNN